MIRITDLTRMYGSFTAVDRMSLAIREGSVFGLLGPNGAGKTTTVKRIAGLLRPTSGKILVDDVDVAGNPMAVKTARGYVPESPAIFRTLSGRELMTRVGRLHRMDEHELAHRAGELLESFGLGGKAEKQLIRGLAEAGKTVVFCSHILEVVERICDEIAIVAQGKVRAQGTVSAIMGQNHAFSWPSSWSWSSQPSSRARRTWRSTCPSLSRRAPAWGQRSPSRASSVLRSRWPSRSLLYSLTPVAGVRVTHRAAELYALVDAAFLASILVIVLLGATARFISYRHVGEVATWAQFVVLIAVYGVFFFFQRSAGSASSVVLGFHPLLLLAPSPWAASLLRLGSGSPARADGCGGAPRSAASLSRWPTSSATNPQFRMGILTIIPVAILYVGIILFANRAPILDPFTAAGRSGFASISCTSRWASSRPT